MNRMWVSVVGAVCLATSAQAAPDLSAAYAKPLWMQTAMMVRTELAQDDLDKPEGPDETWAREDTFSAAPVGEATSSRSVGQPEPASQAEMARQRDLYDSGRALHRAGNISTLVGGLLVVPLALGTFAAAWGGNDGTAGILAVGTVGAAGAFYAGGILSSVGALKATRAMNAAFGMNVPTDLAVGGIVSSSAGILLTPLVVGGFAPIVGIICGVLQLQQVNRALHSIGVADFQIAPTPQGFAMSMRF